MQTLHNSKAFLFCLMLLNEHFVGWNFVVCIVDTWGWESCCCIIAIHNTVLIVTRDLYGFKFVYVDRGKTLVRYLLYPQTSQYFAFMLLKSIYWFLALPFYHRLIGLPPNFDLHVVEKFGLFSLYDIVIFARDLLLLECLPVLDTQFTSVDVLCWLISIYWSLSIYWVLNIFSWIR